MELVVGDFIIYSKRLTGERGGSNSEGSNVSTLIVDRSKGFSRGVGLIKFNRSRKSICGSRGRVYSINSNSSNRRIVILFSDRSKAFNRGVGLIKFNRFYKSICGSRG